MNRFNFYEENFKINFDWLRCRRWRPFKGGYCTHNWQARRRELPKVCPRCGGKVRTEIQYRGYHYFVRYVARRWGVDEEFVSDDMVKNAREMLSIKRAIRKYKERRCPHESTGS